MQKLPLGTKKLPKQEYFAQSGRTVAEDGRQLVLKKRLFEIPADQPTLTLLLENWNDRLILLFED